MDKIRDKVSSSLKRDHMAITRIPQQGRTPAAVLALLQQREAHNVRISPGQSSLSGVVYIKDESHKQLLDNVYTLFSWSNPLHADVFPSVRQMEAEVIAMAVHMTRGGPGTAAPEACGAMTSGGTESILLAVKAARDYARETRGVTEPEMIIGPSAHAAYWKAAEYFKVTLKIVPLGADYRLHGSAVAKRISSNTVLVVASAPSFPHGLIDDVAGISAAAAAKGVPCHVDACLGGFVLPFAARLGRAIPPWDFTLRGVTSISLDTHKFGMAHKGTSLILYRFPELRRQQYTCITDWPGGLYISPSMAGSRNGALIATAWASLVHLGESGLQEAAEVILSAATEFRHRLVIEVPELMLVGQPEVMVVAFKAVDPRRLNIYRVNDLLTARGWHLNALQSPPALHFCFTAQHGGAVPALLQDIKWAVRVAVAEKAARGKAVDAGQAVPKEEEGSAPVYGLAGASPDRGLVAEFLTVYQDTMLAP